MNEVDSPQHYMHGGIETIYAIQAILGQEGFKAYCLGNFLKYTARAKYKGNEAQDLLKANKYMEWYAGGLPTLTRDK